MKWNLIASIVSFIAGCILLLFSGCEEQAALPGAFEPETASSPAAELARFRAQYSISSAEPRIMFESLVHDFGQIGSGASHYCEFRFGNAGNGILEIKQITKSCGCTPYELAKTKYAPGESGILKVNYNSDSMPGTVEQQLVVYTNDKNEPRVTLTVKATVVTKVDCEPKKLELLLTKENSSCPEITLRSSDNQPFSIMGIKSTANCITADFNPSAKATSFVIRPKVNVKKLQQGVEGLIAISLSHPECSEVMIPFISPAKFKISPASVTVFNAEPQKPIVRKIWIVNNYGEDFEVQSVTSKNNSIKVLSRQKTSNGYELEVQITPPAAAQNSTMFSDVLAVNIKGGEKVETSCNGFYLGRTTPVAASSGLSRATTSSTKRNSSSPLPPPVQEEECRTCKPHLITDWSKPNP